MSYMLEKAHVLEILNSSLNAAESRSKYFFLKDDITPAIHFLQKSSSDQIQLSARYTLRTFSDGSEAFFTFEKLLKQIYQLHLQEKFLSPEIATKLENLLPDARAESGASTHLPKFRP